ncbi:MAG: hypothetical protein V1922_01115 [bacterium]
MKEKRDEKKKEESILKLKKFRVEQLNNFKVKVLAPVEKLHWKIIEGFRDEWGIPHEGIQTNTELEEWYAQVQIKHPEKKYDVVYKKEEDFHIIEDDAIVDTIHLAQFEEQPYVMNLGNSPQAVLDYEVKMLMNKLNLDHDWAKLFKQYLLFKRDLITSVRNPSIDITEVKTFDKNSQPLEHRIALNITPNTSIDEMQMLWNLIIEPLQQKIRGHWLTKKRKSPLQPLLEKLIELDMEDQRTDIHRSDYEKADLLFGSIDDNEKYNTWSEDKRNKLENKRIRQVANLRRQYKKLLPTQ